ncbi:nucleotidyltransferase family protein [Methylobacterium sp. BTF04]|uniref:nucleotidyltransferase family protein n=1 Tax=Methylobacterium sp. BTF04 TaxID=2708300 RepID=UPI0013D81ADC|nr:nucleotidyltransferase family protein [Methylobacterium sp. BTF04]NEU13056.1 nucleotidyltransferase family protein [Methylobacterium sp. BTF04]
MPEIGIVILAAGRGTRFGAEPKLLSLLGGKPLVRHAAAAAVASRLGLVIVVLGAHGEAMRAALDGLDLTLVDNPHFADGLSTSLRAGLAAMPDTVTGVLVLLADMPRITADHLTALADAYSGADPAPAAVVPVNAGRRGNPVLLDRRRLADDLASLTGDQGAGRILARRSDVLEVAMDAAVAADIDTPAALAALAGGPEPRPQEALPRFASARHRSEQ